MRFATRVMLLVSVVGLIALSPSALGQAVYGSIYGTVTDATGAAVPGANVTVTDVAKGTTVTVQSNGSGDFTVEHLIPDVYDVKVDASGFKGYQQRGIQLFADTSVKVTAALTTGGSDITVEVRADEVPQLKTDRADVATIFGAREVQDLPVVGRNFTALQLLLPGAQELGFSHAASEDPQGSKQIMVNGQTFAGVAYALDGTDNQDPILGIIVINPNLDSLSETKITTQNYDAEFGKAVASVVTAQTKSGSNNFHGSGFWYRISAANLARDPFKQGPNTPFPQALKSLFGGSIGGPILKDKLFFFGDYQGIRQKLGLSNLNTVPTAQLVATCLGQRVGPSGIAGCDFSEYRNITPAGAGIIYQANGTPYSGNVIPASQVSPQAKALFAQLQPYAPNSFSDNTYPGLRNNYSGSGTGILNSDQWDVRGDYQASERIHVFGRFSRFTDIVTGATLFGAAGGPGFGLGGYGGTSKGANDSAALGTDIAVNAKLVTDIRLGYFRYNIGTQKYSTNNLATQLGIPGLNTGVFGSEGAPAFDITEVGAQGQPNNGQNAGPQYGSGLNTNRCNCPLIEREDQYQLVNNWTKILGNHSLKVGADLRYARNLRVPSDNNRTGILQFGTGPTSNPNQAQQGGLGFATLALGDVTNFLRFVSTSTNAKEFQKRTFFYAQDTWRATPKLTVNYGLRYEIYFPETINGPGNGALLDLNTGYLNVAGVGTVGSNMNWDRLKNTYNPRVGVAYQVQPTTVIRAGYGRSFDLGVFGSIFGHAATQNLPVLSNQQVTNTGGITSTAFTLAQGPPAPTPIAVPGNGLLPSPGYAVTSKARPNPLRLPTLDAWNVALQQALTPTLSLTMAYVANKGTHTLFDASGQLENPNEAAIVLPAQYSVTGQQLHYDPTGGTCYPAGPGCTPSGVGTGVKKLIQNGATSNQTFLQRYYGGKLPACADPAYLSAPGAAAALAGLPAGSCGWANGINFYASDADTHYNAMQVTLAKQFTHGYSVTANYAWQRGVSYASNFYTWNPRAVKGRDSNIRQQQIIIYGLAELPFGRNKPILSHANAVVNQIVGGWQISPVLNYSSGLPFTLSYSSCNASIPGSAPCLVNGDPGRFQKHVTGFPGNSLSYYDPQTLGSVFTAPGLDQIGNVGRNSVFGPHFFNTDVSVLKNFPIKESVSLQLRMDAFNAFNHINFGLPGGNIQQSGSITNGPGVDGSANPRQLQFAARVQF
jgi:outer membrane receptor protein involved in Fe transport